MTQTWNFDQIQEANTYNYNMAMDERLLKFSSSEVKLIQLYVFTHGILQHYQ